MRYPLVLPLSHHWDLVLKDPKKSRRVAYIWGLRHLCWGERTRISNYPRDFQDGGVPHCRGCGHALPLSAYQRMCFHASMQGIELGPFTGYQAALLEVHRRKNRILIEDYHAH